jgi:hypothetical protein
MRNNVLTFGFTLPTASGAVAAAEKRWGFRTRKRVCRRTDLAADGHRRKRQRRCALTRPGFAQQHCQRP